MGLNQRHNDTAHEEQIYSQIVDLHKFKMS